MGALEMFAAKRTNDGQGVTIPSQIRYVRLFKESWQERNVRERHVRLVEVRVNEILKSKFLGTDVRLEVTAPGGAAIFDTTRWEPSETASDLVFNLRDQHVDLHDDFNVIVWH